MISDSPNLTGMFSETVEYLIHFGANGGQANASINLQTVPEPASIALLGGGLLALGGFTAKRRRKSKAA